MEQDRRFSAVVLDGGRSTRMGKDKGFLRAGGELLIARQLRCLREAGASELLISGRPGVDYSRIVTAFDTGLSARLVHDGWSNAGPLAGVASALAAAAFSRLLVLAVDMPEMTSAQLRKIIAGCTEDSGCVPITSQGLEPLAAVYPRTLVPMAEEHLSTGKNSMQEFVNAGVAMDRVRLLKVEPEEQACFINWNRPEDWRDA